MSRRALETVAVLLVVIASSTAAAYELRGRVLDDVSSRPLAGASITLLGPDGKLLEEARTDEQGQFSFSEIAVAAVRLKAAHEGYEGVIVERVDLDDGISDDQVIRLPRRAHALDTVVVTASRTEETDLDAPASVSVVLPEDIAIRQDFFPTDALRSVTGVSHARKGLISSTFNLRAPAGVTNGSTLLLQDWRNTRLPAFTYNLPYILAATPADIDRIEVIRGPAGVLYGPEAGAGVVHVFTKSSFDHQGSSVSVGAGNRSLFESWGRHSGLISDRLGYQLTLRYLAGEDWIPTVPAAVADSPPDVKQLNGQASLEWHPGDEDRLILTAGRASTRDLLEQFPAYYVNIGEFANSFLQARYHRRQAMVNLVYNENHTEDGVGVPTGAPIVENSRVYLGQVQDGRTFQFGGLTHRTSYGLDFRTTNVRTDGTLAGRYEDNDTVTELGGFLQATTAVSSKLDLLGALRVDYHDRLATGFAFPWRLGAVFQPARDHALRLTASRQAGSSGPGFLFQDSPAGGSYPYELSLISAPASGWNFQRDPSGQLRMRSAFVPGGLDIFGAADATRTWQAMQFQFDGLAGIPAPGSEQVSTMLRTLNLGTGSFDPVAPDDVEDIAQTDREYRNRLEVGYKGFVGDRLTLDLTVYGARYENLVTGLEVRTPNVFFDPGSLETYLAGYMSEEEAQALARSMAGLPVGTVAPAEIGASSEIILGNPQGGTSTQWGVDLGTEYWLTGDWIVRASYSWAPPETVDLEPGRISPRNMPRHRGLVSLAYRLDGRGLTGLAEVRGQTEYDMHVGAWRGRLPGFAVVDLSLGYRFPGRTGLSAFLTATNVLDKRYVEIVGGKELGRLLMLRMQLDFL